MVEHHKDGNPTPIPGRIGNTTGSPLHFETWPPSDGHKQREIEVRKFAVSQMMEHADRWTTTALISSADKLSKFILNGETEEQETTND